jgi:hypothetical protein
MILLFGPRHYNHHRRNVSSNDDARRTTHDADASYAYPCWTPEMDDMDAIYIDQLNSSHPTLVIYGTTYTLYSMTKKRVEECVRALLTAKGEVVGRRRAFHHSRHQPPRYTLYAICTHARGVIALVSTSDDKLRSDYLAFISICRARLDCQPRG